MRRHIRHAAQFVIPLLPERIQWKLRMHMHVRDMIAFGPHAPLPRVCNICGHKGLFDPFGWPMRIDARCPACGSLERHRLLKMWVDESRSALEGKAVLHFAPEPAVTGFVRPIAGSYLTADLSGVGVNHALNIESMEWPSASLNAVICSHVLEHVDDRKALAEIWRVLTSSGIAILLVPLIEGWEATFEDPAIITPEARARYYGQSDHVRMFGSDFRQRVRAAGFTLDEFTAVEPFVSRHGLLHGEKVFIASKVT
jgi:SAM-dependent methyltransferase